MTPANPTQANGSRQRLLRRNFVVVILQLLSVMITWLGNRHPGQLRAKLPD